MTRKELAKKQTKLDNEKLDCPNCDGKMTWLDRREVGICIRCYYKDLEKRNKTK